MRVFRLELKKILKSRRTIILIALSLFMSVLMAYLPVTFVYVTQYDDAGNYETCSGRVSGVSAGI